jgi:hypothetical protein
MSDESQKFQVEVTDSVASTIAPKLKAIGDEAKIAHANVEKLKIELSSLNASGASALKAQVEASEGSTAKLNQQLKNITTSNKEVASSSQQLGAAFSNSSSSALRLAEISNQLSQAKKNLNTSTRNLAQAEKDLTGANGATSTSGRSIIESYRQQQQASAALVDRLTVAKKEASAFGKSQEDAGKAAHGSVTGVQSASAAIRVLEGNFGTNVRAAENFLVKIAGMGPILQAAFPLVGAIALIGVLDILAEHVDKLREHWRNLGVDAQQAALKMLAAGQVKLEGEKGIKSTVGNFFLGRQNTPDLILPDPSISLQSIQTELRLKTAMDEVNLSGKTGLELQKAKVQAIQNEIENTRKAIEKAKELRDTAQAQLAATVSVNKNTLDPKVLALGPGLGSAVNFVRGFQDETQSKFPVDSKQFKELESQFKQYDSQVVQLTSDYAILKQAKLPEAMQKEPLAAARDGLKAAREQLKLFKEEFGKKESEQGVLSPQARLALLQGQLNRALPENKPELQGRVGVAQEAVDRQAATIELIRTRLKDQADAIGLVSDAERSKHENDKLDQELMRNQVPIVGGVADEFHKLTNEIVAASNYQRELNRVYQEANGPQITYKAGVEAIADLLERKLITDAQAVVANNELTLSYERSKDPLLDYNKGIKDQIDLLGKFGDELTVATEIQKLQNQLRERGRSLSQFEITQLTTALTQLEKSKVIQQQLNQLYQQHEGTMQKLVLTYVALNEARKKGLITGEQEKVELTKIKIAIADLQVQMHKGSGKDLLTSVFGDYLKDYKGFTKGVTDLWKGTFQTIADGAADSIGRAIVYGENLGDSLKEVARTALSELISGMIKLGIQMVIQATIGQTIGNAIMATSMAQAAALASAWAAPAIEADIATLGGASAAADVAYGLSLGFAQGLAATSSVLRFAQGGVVPGFGDRDSVPAFLTPGEGILNRNAMRQFGADNLNRLNAGAKNLQSSVGGDSKGLVINVEHDGSTGVRIERTDPNEIKIIARTEVEKHAARVVAGDLENPNSRVSKAVVRTNETKRRR